MYTVTCKPIGLGGTPVEINVLCCWTYFCQCIKCTISHRNK